MSKNIKSFNLEEITNAKVTVELELSMIEVDYESKSPTGYQREPKPYDIRKMMEDFVPEACRHLLVGQREDGRYFCVDGNHERIALMKLGLKKWMCEVFQSSGPALEARVFAIVNKKRRSVSAWNTHRAEVVAQNPDALALENIVDSAGFKVAQNGSWPAIACIVALKRSYSFDKGSSLLFSLKLICRRWLACEDALRGEIISGITLFIYRAGEKLDVKRLESLMEKKGPKWLLQKTSQEFPHGVTGGGRDACVCKTLAGIYNTRLSDKRRVDFNDKEQR